MLAKKPTYYLLLCSLWIIPLLLAGSKAILISTSWAEQSQDEQIENEFNEELDQDLIDTLEGNIDNDVENILDDKIESNMEYYFEDSIEDNFENKIEDKVEEGIESEVEGEIEDNVENEIEDNVEGGIENELENNINNDIEEDIESNVEGEIEETLEKTIDDEIDNTNLVNKKLSPITKINQYRETNNRDNFDLELDNNESFRVRDQLLILTDNKSLADLQQQGFEVKKITPLLGLDSVLAVVIKPNHLKLEQAKQVSIQLLGSQDNIDFNHFYQLQSSNLPLKKQHKSSKKIKSWEQPHQLLTLPSLTKHNIKVGIIDSWVNTQHESFKYTDIQLRSFSTVDTQQTSDHGTAVASIICANSKKYRGLLQGSTCYAASAFYYDPKWGSGTTTTQVILALNWLAQMDVDVINMSLTGPHNQVLEKALRLLHERGTVLVAAAGNAGPASKPLFPAAYDYVVAVTAVNQKELAYFYANRGLHIDLAAPGVDILHATADGLYSHSSGTSFAAAFVSATFAAAIANTDNGKNTKQTNQLTKKVYQQAKDLGKPGHDAIYGHGLIRPLTLIKD